MQYLRCIEQAALIAVVLVFAWRGLLKYYPAFMLFLIAKGTRSLCLLSLDYHDPLYGKCWAISAPVLLTLQVLVLLELTAKIVEHYPKIDRRGAKLIVGSCLVVGGVVGAVSTSVQFGNGQCPWYVPAAVGASKFVDWISVGTLGFISVWIALSLNPSEEMFSGIAGYWLRTLASRRASLSCFQPWPRVNVFWAISQTGP